MALKQIEVTRGGARLILDADRRFLVPSPVPLERVDGIPQYSYDAVFDGASMWIASYAGALTRIDVETNTIAARVGVAVHGLAFDGRSIWATQGQQSQNVLRIDAATAAIVGQTPVGVATGAIAFDGSAIWVGLEGPDRLAKIAPGQGVLTVGLPGRPTSIVFDGVSIWVGSLSAPGLTQVDPLSNSIIATVSIAAPRTLVFDGTWLWAGTINSINRIDRQAHTVTAYPGSAGKSPRGIAFDGSRLWCAGAWDNVFVVDPANPAAPRSIGVPSPFGLAFDGTHMWITTYGGTVFKMPALIV